MGEKLKLYGFNNLTKALSFNIYDVCYAKTAREQKDYIDYIDEQYNAERLTGILTTLTDMIGATVLNIARQDYEPQGASVTLLIAEDSMLPRSQTQLAHLDKSHVTVHTYPEYHPETCIATFRVDIDVATCGEITPLSTLDYLIGSFDSDIITMDYRVRGFTRDVNGKKLFLDHPVTSIQDYINPEILRRYDAVDINVYAASLFHTRMMIKEPDLQNYLFKTDIYELPPLDPAGDHEQPPPGNDRDFQRQKHLLGGKRVKELSQERAPIYEALERFNKMRVVPFDVPGHKRGRGNPELTPASGGERIRLDVNSMKPLDNLCHPVSGDPGSGRSGGGGFSCIHAFLWWEGRPPQCRA